MSSPNPFDDIQLDPVQNKRLSLQYPDNPFFDIDLPEEPVGKNAFRTAVQIPQGIAEGTGPGLLANLWSLFAHGESELDPYEEASLYEASKRAGKEFSKEEYEEERQNALSYLPTISNISREVEAKTGLPLEPKTKLQKFTRFASTAGKLSPKDYTFRGMNTSLPRPVLGTGVAGVKELLTELGVPEVLSEPLSFAILKQPTEGAGSFKVGMKRKESGLTERRFEKITEPTEVSGTRIAKINDAIEGEFRDLSNRIIKESPISQTHAELRNNAAFKREASRAFEEVRDLAESIPDTVSGETIKSNISSYVKDKRFKGITPSEYDKTHARFINEFIKETPSGDYSLADLVDQYRKTNRELRDLYEPGQSFAYNGAKREAYLDYNRSIAEYIEKKYPDTEFAKLFKQTNETWTKISDAEAIDKFLDALFDGKIDYKKGRDFFDKAGMTKSFERALGKEGFAKFETLMNDLVSTEQAMRLLKKAKTMGFGDVAETAGAYVLHPTYGKLKLGYKAIKSGYKQLFEMLLDKPQLAVTWDRGVNAMKAGNFKVAEKQFAKMEEAKKEFNTKKEALKKFNERKSSDKTLEAPQEKAVEVPQVKEITQQEIEAKLAAAEKPVKAETKDPAAVKEKPKPEAPKPQVKKAEPKPKKLKAVSPKPQASKPEKKVPEAKPFEYTKEDFPTKKEAEDYLAHLRRQDARPNTPAKSHPKTIENLENLIKSYEITPKISKKIDQKVSQIQRQDISTAGLKKQKTYFTDKLDEMLKKAEFTGKMVEIKIPEDGTFKVLDQKDSIEKILKKVKSKWPTGSKSERLKNYRSYR